MARLVSFPLLDPIQELLPREVGVDPFFPAVPHRVHLTRQPVLRCRVPIGPRGSHRILRCVVRGNQSFQRKIIIVVRIVICSCRIIVDDGSEEFVRHDELVQDRVVPSPELRVVVEVFEVGGIAEVDLGVQVHRQIAVVLRAARAPSFFGDSIPPSPSSKGGDGGLHVVMPSALLDSHVRAVVVVRMRRRRRRRHSRHADASGASTTTAMPAV
mmetsp:Transcript_12430/g.30388  ORF Transcript_12430/g.30388 Transcript_12430/m.30388 type:complete len:213 (+) Transcript_12430:1272-1910(+)